MILDGWKEIADKLHASVRTVQRWAQREHDPLPVMVNPATRRIAADSTLVDRWIARQWRPVSHGDVS